MRRSNKNAFTLIELLAVIVILAIIALIAVPVIMNIIDKANKSAFKDTAYGIISAGELYFAEQQLDVNGMSNNERIQLPDTTKKLELKGEVPEGEILITKDGKIALFIKNNRYCITKGLDDKDITITEDVENCEMPKVLVTNGVMNSYSSCIKSRTCTTDEIKEGIKVNVKVNESENYDFYVISDTGTELTLIMDSNLGDNVKWYFNAIDNSYGPKTAVDALKERTNDWTNIEEKDYTYSDDGGGNKYKSFTRTMRARMLTYTEATTMLGCELYSSDGSTSGSCPIWLYINLKNTGSDADGAGTNKLGYWTSAAKASSNSPHNIEYKGYVSSSNASLSTNGIRPVIELTK